MAHDSTAGLPCLPLPVAQEYDRPLSFDPLGSTDRPRPGLCPQTSGPVRDPARTAPNRADLRIVRVPLTCLAPSPLSSNFRDLTPFRCAPRYQRQPSRIGRNPEGVPARSARTLFQKPATCGRRPPYTGLPQSGEPDYHLDFYLTPRSFRVSPLGPFPGFSPPRRPGVFKPNPTRRLLTRRESAVPPPFGRRGALPVRGLHEWS